MKYLDLRVCPNFRLSSFNGVGCGRCDIASCLIECLPGSKLTSNLQLEMVSAHWDFHWYSQFLGDHVAFEMLVVGVYNNIQSVCITFKEISQFCKIGHDRNWFLLEDLIVPIGLYYVQKGNLGSKLRHHWYYQSHHTSQLSLQQLQMKRDIRKPTKKVHLHMNPSNHGLIQFYPS